MQPKNLPVNYKIEYLLINYIPHAKSWTAAMSSTAPCYAFLKD